MYAFPCIIVLMDTQFSKYKWTAPLPVNSTPGWIAISVLCNRPLPSVNLCTPNDLFLVTLLSVKIFSLCSSFDLSSQWPHCCPACYLYSSAIDVPYPRKRCPGLPQIYLSPYILVPLWEGLAGTKHSRYFNSTVESLPQRGRSHF